MASTEPVEEVLGRYGSLTAQAMLKYLPKSEPENYLYDLVADYPTRGGKAIRPSLCLAACVAFGGSVDEAMPSAVAIELLHNAFLIHDDVEDSSLLRRGRPTLTASAGQPLAINAGDALAVLAQKPLRDNRRRLSTAIAATVAEEFDLMERRTLEGQATELGWRRDNKLDLSPSDYVDLVLRKTCWYTTINPLRVGALIGSWGAADLEPVVVFGSFLGVAFQIADDLLNLTPNASQYGKELFGDIREGKRTLMLIHLLGSVQPKDRAFLRDYLAEDAARRMNEDVREVYDLMVGYGSLDFAVRFSRGIAEAARGSFASAFYEVRESSERQFLWDMIDWMLDRQW
jgi:geranylgeranyl diphosphate synthase, type II